MSDLVGALEIGGTHVSAGRVDVKRRCLDSSGIRRFAIDPANTRDQLLAAIRDAALVIAGPEIQRVGVATAGPFDYERGTALFRAVAKLDALYGVDLRDFLARTLGIDPPRIRFLNDAQAFVIGEWWAGAAKGHARAMGITLGTGLGSGFVAGGELVLIGPEIPPESRLDLVPFRTRAVEDVLSSRGIVAAYGERIDVAEIARRARAGEAKALATFHAFGSALGEFLDPWIVRFGPSGLVFGGSITRAWGLFADAFRGACPAAAAILYAGPAERVDDAPLLGAALHATRAQSEAP